MDNLSRLAAKPGVQSTLILSKADGSIIRTSGLLAGSSSPPGSSSSRPTSSSSGGGAGATDTASGHADGTHAEAYYEVIHAKDENSNEKRAEDVAKMVFSFVSNAGGFVQGMDEGDELKLLRIRTRKSEIVIVPGKVLPVHFSACFLLNFFWGLYQQAGNGGREKIIFFFLGIFNANILCHCVAFSRYKILIGGYS